MAATLQQAFDAAKHIVFLTGVGYQHRQGFRITARKMACIPVIATRNTI